MSPQSTLPQIVAFKDVNEIRLYTAHIHTCRADTNICHFVHAFACPPSPGGSLTPINITNYLQHCMWVWREERGNDRQFNAPNSLQQLLLQQQQLLL